MAVICIGSVCFSLFQIGIIIFVILNFLSSYFKKFFISIFSGPTERDAEIEIFLKKRKEENRLEKSHFIELSTSPNLQEVFAATKNPTVVLKFGATWCPPCKQIKSYFMSQKNYYDVTLVDIDVDQHKNLQKEHNVRALPTFKFYLYLNNTWEFVHQIQGARQDELEMAFKKFCVAKI